MKLQAPIEVELKVSIISPEGKTAGVATIGLGKGAYPTEQSMRDAIAKFEAESMPDGFRLMNKREWFNTVVPPHVEEEDGAVYTTPFAIPGGDDWDE